MVQTKKFKVEYWNSEYAAFTREITIQAHDEEHAKFIVSKSFGITLIESITEII